MIKKYNLVNNLLGWLCFVIAAVTYLLTIEPTASFWDCPEFILQSAKLEVGHPPGNPIFMLAGRFFITIFGGIEHAAVAVNCMSALLSAGTILLMFWSITHLARRLVIRDDWQGCTWTRVCVVMGAGLCGALAYTWSDTFWFSAVEGEVYAFSSFCTALVFWLILKWENRADEPHSDRYLVLIAYVIGVSIGVHLLNLLCIPALCLVFYYRKAKRSTGRGSLLTLLVSFAIVAFILFGLVPGFMTVAQGFELFFVNDIGLGYNAGVLIYAVLLIAVFIFTIHALYSQKNPVAIKVGFFLSMFLSGILFLGHGWVIPVILTLGLAGWLAFACRPVPVRVLNVITLSVFVIFIGYSSYALLLIRANSGTPMNQNAPDNVFDLATYMSREQYGETPLLTGPTFAENLATVDDGQGNRYVALDREGYPQVDVMRPYVFAASGEPIDNGTNSYTKAVKHSPDEPDQYVKENYKPDYQTTSDLSVLFPRIYSSDPSHVAGYKGWSEYSPEYYGDIPMETRARWMQQYGGYAPMAEVAPYLNSDMKEVRTRLDESGSLTDPQPAWVPGYWTNVKYFINYQLVHMYWRYFMWNFAGRQNDMAGNGEPHLGNWISGIPAIDNARLGDQSLLPAEYTTGNKGHNVFFMLPLFMGIIGLLWQALARHANSEEHPQRGIEQFWVVCFLFIMTGIAIVLYLNQTPGQPRERDYAFAGSFYAYGLWIGLGVAGVWKGLMALMTRRAKAPATSATPVKEAASEASATLNSQLSTLNSKICATVAIALGILVPIQMVSQTWDDHDRSGRYTARDFGFNYLNSVDKDGIIFTYGDNDTFPLWYAQEVEGFRTDVRVINLSYLTTDWYANHLRRPYYDAKPVPMYAGPTDYGYGRMAWSFVNPQASDSVAEAQSALAAFYKKIDVSKPGDMNTFMDFAKLRIPVNAAAANARWGVAPGDTAVTAGDMVFSLASPGSGFGLNKLLMADIITNSMKGGHRRPVYVASTVPGSEFAAWQPYASNVGMAQEIVPFQNAATSGVNAEKAYENIMSRFAWGGLDQPGAKNVYLDETVRRMVSSTRGAVTDAAQRLMDNGKHPASAWARQWAAKHGQPAPATYNDMARLLLDLIDQKLPVAISPYDGLSGIDMANLRVNLYMAAGNPSDLRKAREALTDAQRRYGQFTRYAASLSPYRAGLLTSADNVNFYALASAIGQANRLALYEALSKDPVKNADILEVLRMPVDTTTAYYLYELLYINRLGADEIAAAAQQGGYDRQLLALAAAYLEAHKATGISQMAKTQEVASSNGLTPEQIQRVFSQHVQ